MSHKKAIHDLLGRISGEILEFIKEQELTFEDRWVPAAHIKSSLDLYFASVPKGGKQYGEKGWLFAIIARMLEDNDLVEYKKIKRRAYYRSI